MTMKVSNLKFTTEMLNDVWKGHSIEMPNADAHRLVSNPKAAANYIAEFGDVEIVLNTEYAPHWQVAAFKVGREEYGKLKQAYCNQYGSNQGLTNHRKKPGPFLRLSLIKESLVFFWFSLKFRLDLCR